MARADRLPRKKKKKPQPMKDPTRAGDVEVKPEAGDAGPQYDEYNDPALIRAEELARQAEKERDKKRKINLATKAIVESPNCTEAYLILAEHATENDDDKLLYLEKAVAAGRRVIGKEFDEFKGRMWKYYCTRPYMEARLELARHLIRTGRYQEGIDHCLEMTELDEGDHQGNCYRLLHWYLLIDRDDKSWEVYRDLKKYLGKEKLYPKALLAYRRDGVTPKTKTKFRAAMNHSYLTMCYLMGKKRIPPPFSGDYFTGEDLYIHIAAEYARDFRIVWEEDPAALGVFLEIEEEEVFGG